MSFYLRVGFIVLVCIVGLEVLGCPRKEHQVSPPSVYHTGSWAGTVNTQARLVKKLSSEYWNAAWRIEGMVKLDEYQDGSLKGKASCDFFFWELFDPRLHGFNEIAKGQWKKYTVFEIELEGEITEEGYELRAKRIPPSLPDPARLGEVIEFWDFLFPSVIRGEWGEGGRTLMEGESIRPQGKDLLVTMQQEDYRESDVKYFWSIRKL